MIEQISILNIIVYIPSLFIGIYLYKILNDIWKKVKSDEEAKIRWYYFLSFGIVNCMVIMLFSLARIIEAFSEIFGIENLRILAGSVIPLLISASALSILMFAHERYLGGVK